ncbi:hypothetical protein [Streptomyces hiroshimensis]|nr:hypothetical protein [Streptomyces hiroshimensis]
MRTKERGLRSGSDVVLTFKTGSAARMEETDDVEVSVFPSRRGR